MEEKFTIDADCELVMIDELDDISYQPKLYGLNSILPEDPESILKKVTLNVKNGLEQKFGDK